VKKGGRFRGVGVLSTGSLAGGIASFVRNIVVARLISVEDMGIAATFAMTVALIGLASDMAIDRLLIQARDGNEARLQASAHAFQVLRGTIGAVLLYVIAEPVALLFEIPDVIWAFQVLALVPLIRSFSHLDFARLQREMKFVPYVLVRNGPELLALLLAYPVGLYFADFRLMLWLVLIQTLAFTVFSHIVAKRKYSWGWDKVLIKRMIAFGWPLLINGFLMFGIFQGDRAIVGANFGVGDLGWFSIAFSLTLVPTLMIVGVLSSFFLPQLSEVQDDKGLFEERSLLVIQICLLLGVLLTIGFAISGPALLLSIYGDRYASGAAFVALLGYMQGIRLVRVGPTIVALAKGETRNPLYANIARTIGLAISAASVLIGYGLLGVVLGALIGESLALLTSFRLLYRKIDLSVRKITPSFLVAFLMSSVTVIAASQIITADAPWLEIPAGILAVLLTGGLCLLVMPEIRNRLPCKDHTAGREAG